MGMGVKPYYLHCIEHACMHTYLYLYLYLPLPPMRVSHRYVSPCRTRCAALTFRGWSNTCAGCVCSGSALSKANLAAWWARALIGRLLEENKQRAHPVTLCDPANIPYYVHCAHIGSVAVRMRTMSAMHMMPAKDPNEQLLFTAFVAKA